MLNVYVHHLMHLFVFNISAYYGEHKHLFEDARYNDKEYYVNDFYCCTEHFDNIKIPFTNKCTLY
jgi:hypothetical protein